MNIEIARNLISHHPTFVGTKNLIIGVRGYFLGEALSRVNEMYVSDDAFLRVIGDEVTVWRGSTDPGRYWVEHPINPKGCARLVPQQTWYKVGIHLNVHPAFVQDDAVLVERLAADGTVRMREFGEFGINIHSEGPEYLVGKWSAGCQVIQCPEGPWGLTWQRFFAPFAGAVGKERFPYILVENKDPDLCK